MRILLAFLLLASTAVAQTTTRSYTGIDVSRYAPTPTSMTINASGEGVTYIVSLPRSGTITHVGYRLGNTTEEDTLAISIETVGTDGKASGSNYGGSTAGTDTFTNAADNVTRHVALGTSATAVAGNLVAVVIDFNSFTDGNLNISCGNGTSNNSMPNVLHNTGAGYSRLTAAAPMLYLYYSDNGGEYRVPVGCYPPATISSINIQSDTTPDEVALKFTAPFACRVNGVMWGTVAESGSTAEINFDLLSSAATPLSLLTAPTVMTHDTIQGTTALLIGMEQESVTASQSVYFSVFSEDATNNLNLPYLEVSDAAHWGDFMPHIIWASRTRTDDTANGGPGWTDLSTRKPIAGVFFDQVTAGSNTIDPLTGTIPGL